MFLDKYKIEQIAQSNMCVVYKAQLKDSTNYSIIKKIFTKNISMEWINDFIKIIKDINHPNIVKLIDISENDLPNILYIKNEFCNGGSILDYLKQNNKSFTEEEVQYIMKQAILAVKYLHDKKIINRNIITKHLLLNYNSDEDLSKKNILKAKIKLNNFSFSTYYKKGNLLNEKLGNMNYTAPEIMFNKYNEKADIWSLGIICCELLAGSLPYSGINLYKTGNIDYFLPTTLSQETVSFINCMLQYDPQTRKSTHELLKHEFLNKNVKDFKKLNLSDISEHIKNSKIEINIKENEWIFKAFGWGIIDE